MLLLFITTLFSQGNVSAFTTANYNDTYIMHASLDGKEVGFTLDTTSLITRGSDKVTKGVHLLAVSTAKPISINVARLTQLNPGEDLSLGYDVIKTGSIGYDQAESKVYYWPNGIGSSKAASEWVSSNSDPRFPKSNGTIQASLDTTGPGLPCIKALVQGKQAKLIVSYPLFSTLINAFPNKAEDKTFSIRFAAPVDLGETSSTWVVVSNFFEGLNPYINTPFDGSISSDNYFCQRTLYDFPSKTFTYQRYSAEDRLVSFLEQITHLPLKFIGDKLILGGPSLKPEYAAFSGAEIIRFGEFKTKDILTALKIKDSTSISLLDHFYDVIRKGYDLFVMYSDGTVHNFSVQAETGE